MPLAPGSKLGSYEIVALIGAGGMGEVYRARDEVLQRDVALKILQPDSSGTRAEDDTLLREARAACALNNPQICTIYEVGESAGHRYIAMEFVEGQPLSRIIPGEGLPRALVFRYGQQIASALDHAHDRGIIHRDIKTANIVITPSGQAKILDFGLARRVKSSELTDATHSMQTMSEDEGLAGTLPYMAPEILRGAPADPRSDVWALGVVLYEMSAGERPFRGSTGYEISSAILSTQPVPLPPPATAGLRVVVDRCLEKEPGHRYQRAGEVRAALEAGQHDSQGIAAGSPPASTAESTSAATSSVGAKTKKRLAWTIGSLTAIAVAVLVALNAGSIRNRSAHSGANGPVQSLAVLPFTDETGDAQLEYLDDGLTESLINGLSRLPQLKVMSRNAVFRYKGKNVDAQAAGNALKVDAVLTGTIRQLGDAIDINAELIDTRDNSQMWGQHYERKLADLASLQQELSVDISEQLRPKLSRSDQQQLQRGPTDNSEAYQLYLKGNYFWNKKTAVDHQRAIELYREAIEKDPKFALAYVGISNSYALMSVNSNLPPRDVLQKAKEAALQALAIDPNLPEAHTALGRVLLSYEYDFAGAEKELERANELNASDVNSHLWSVELLTAAGRFDEAFAAARRGIQVEPFSSPANGFLARAYYYAGQYEESIGYFRKALELDSHAWFLHLWFGMPLTAVKDYPAAIAEFDKTENVTYEPALRKIYAEAMSGDRQKAEVELEKFVQLSKTQFVPALHIARVYTGLGEKDQAFKWLDRAYEERDFLLIYLNVDPDFAPLRSDPGFATLVRRVGIPVANEQAGPHRK